MNEDQAPPTPLPPAAQPPYPAHPASHPHPTGGPEAKVTHDRTAIEGEGAGPSLKLLALIGGGTVAALGIALLVARNAQQPSPAARKKRGKKVKGAAKGKPAAAECE